METERNPCWRDYHDVVISGGGNEPVYIGSNCVFTGYTLLAHDASTNRFLGIKYG